VLDWLARHNMHHYSLCCGLFNYCKFTFRSIATNISVDLFMKSNDFTTLHLLFFLIKLLFKSRCHVPLMIASEIVLSNLLLNSLFKSLIARLA
jgi:hypothetical protein